MPLPNRAIGDIATWKWLGDALWASGDHGGAIGIYREAIDRQPSMAAPYRWLDSALTSLGRLVEAEEVYKAAQVGRARTLEMARRIVQATWPRAGSSRSTS